MSKKYFISSDVHGFYDEWMLALNEHGFDINNKYHIIVHLGDLLDRGKQPLECLKFVNDIPDSRKILIKGNHEDLLEEALRRKYFLDTDYRNGTLGTIKILADYNDTEIRSNSKEICKNASNNPLLIDYLNSVVDFAEIDTNIFVHGWIPTEVSSEMEFQNPYMYPNYTPEWRSGDWCSARWLNGMEMWRLGVIEPNKTIWCGHWSTEYGHNLLHHEYYSTYGIDLNNLTDNDRYNIKQCCRPFEDNGIVAMDASTTFSGIVNCKVLEV